MLYLTFNHTSNLFFSNILFYFAAEQFSIKEMKRTRLLFAAILAIALTCSCKESVETGFMIKNLDFAIENRAEYFSRHKHEMDSIKSQLQVCKNAKESWRIYKKLHQCYTTFSIDSAAHYAAKMEGIASSSSEKELKFLSRIARITILHAQFEYGEGRKIFELLDTAGISINSLAEYWAVGTRLYRDMIKYQDSSGDEMNDISAKLADLRKDMSERGFFISRECRLKTALMHIDNGNWERAYHILYNIEQEKGLSMHERAVTSYYLSKVYKLAGDDDKRKRSLIKAATIDMMMPNRESFSMWELSQMLFQEGDYARAADYMTLTLNEALACNFKILYLRAIDAKEIITQTIHENSVKMNRILLSCIILALIALGGISYMLAYSNRQRRRLAKANDLIKSMNRKIVKINSELKDANQIKDNYVSLYMKLSTQYIKQVDEERSHLRKIAKTDGMDGIMKVLRSPKFADEEYKRFYHIFDRTFMGLFPNFIEKVNELLPAQEHLSTRSDGSLSTELRILAVIRLGITKSPEIAEVLNCAVRTVYKYRITLRSLSTCPKDNFEEEIKKIGNIDS